MSQNLNKKDGTKSEALKSYEGQVGLTKDLDAYIKIPELNYEAVFVLHKYLSGALQGDKVVVEVIGQDEEGLYGKVISINKRAKHAYAGMLVVNTFSTENRDDEYYIFKPHDIKNYIRIYVDKNADLGAGTINKVAVEMMEMTGDEEAYGRVVRNLGKPGENDGEMLAYAIEKGFSDQHNQAVRDEAEKISGEGISEEEKNKRRDFRDVLTFTIDPADAKDFDDAISYRELGGDLMEVGIHIADVSHYVRPGMALDDESVERETSVYLVDRCIPMLPEELSNDLCSLVQDEDRLVMSAVFDVDINGKIHKEWYGRSVIKSFKRFAYEEAQESMDKNGIYSKELHTLNSLAKKLYQERLDAGALVLDTQEVKFKLDEKGKPVDVYTKERGDTHKMIEELMLLANRKVSEFITSSQKNSKEPICIYRIHDKPDADKMHDLNLFIRGIGEKVKFIDGAIPTKDLNDLLKRMEGRPEKDLLQVNITRSMQKAVYSTHNVGHYGLAFTHYSHFTSPIRRYPDVLTHRLLMRILDGEIPEESERMALEKLCIHASYREKEAADAERGSIKHKQVEYMMDRIGQVFEGVISGVSKFGIYIQESKSKSEGMVRLRDLGDDYYGYEERSNSIAGERSGEKFSIGDRFKIKVAGADVEDKSIDYTVISRV